MHALKVRFVNLKIQLTAWVAGRGWVSLEWLILTPARQLSHRVIHRAGAACPGPHEDCYTPMSAWQKLVDITRRLRAPDGCPWDRKQTMETLRAHLLEETYEVLEAIDSGSRKKLREELGDLLFQITFLSELASEEGAFDVDGVAKGIVDKLVRRHPHVFGDARVGSAEEALQQWEVLKAAERGQERGSPGVLSGVPRELPALLKACRLTNKASQLGFDWPEARQVVDKFQEELEELRRAQEKGDREALEEEFGDLLFTLANLGRHLALDPEVTLQRANRKFIRRFEHMERGLRESGRRWESQSAADLDELWEKAKREV